MKLIVTFIKAIIGELLVVFLLLFVLNNYIGKSEETIKGDAIGYYDYLPSLFIHKDLCRNTKPVDSYPEVYERINGHNYYLEYEGFKVNKYSVGTAILELPFFLTTYSTITLSNDEMDGYQPEFHQSVFYAAIFYLFLGLYFLKRLLRLYGINPFLIVFLQLLVTLGTNITIYSNFDAGYSHVYSFFAVTTFCYFVKSYFQKNSIKYFFWACAFLGLIFLLRQVNILVVLILPFLAGSFSVFKQGVSTFWKQPRKLVIGLTIFLSVVFIQSFFWYLQTGYFIVYSYQGEGFDFFDPEIFKILFSYKKGFFIYTPVMFLFAVSAIWLVIKGRYFLGLTWICFFAILTFVFSSWWSWYYGCSFGMRPFIDYYSIFVVPFALAVSSLHWIPKALVILISLASIPLNIVQSYQHKEYIIDWCAMTKSGYWNVFLRVEPQLKGYVWARPLSTEGYVLLKEIELGTIKLEEREIYFQFNLGPEVPRLKKIRVLIDNKFSLLLNSVITVNVSDNVSQETIYWSNTYLLHFSNQPDVAQTGVCDFNMDIFPGDSSKIAISFSPNDFPTDLKNVRIQLYQ